MEKIYLQSEVGNTDSVSVVKGLHDANEICDVDTCMYIKQTL